MEQTPSGTQSPTEIIKLVPPKLIISGCDTGIIDWELPGGSLLSESFDDCSDVEMAHGEFVSCIATTANQLMTEGYLSGGQMAAIVTCAARPADD